MKPILRLAIIKLFAAVILWNAAGSLCFGQLEMASDSCIEDDRIVSTSGNPSAPINIDCVPLDAHLLCGCCPNPSGRVLQKFPVKFLSTNDWFCRNRASSDLFSFDNGISCGFHVARRHLIFCRWRN